MQELEILQNKETREQMINKVEVLEKVKGLLLLGDSDFATTEQVANYYEVGIEAIQSIIKDNRDELESDGFKKFKKNDILRNVLKGHIVRNERTRSLVVIDGKEIAINNTGLNLFSKRSILRVGMLLRDSEIAKEIRTRLLDIEYESNNAIQDNGQTVKENIINEMDKEKELQLQMGVYICEGNFQGYLQCQAEYNSIKNKRIVELEDKIETITTHALDILESRKVINRLMKTIVFKEFNGKFADCWNELWSKVNYQLGINIRARKEKPLDSLSETEMYEVEKIVRTYANQVGIDVDKNLTLKKAN
jgi:hypothetical protein